MAAAATIQELHLPSDEEPEGGAGILSLADDPDFADVRPLDLRESPERPVVAIQYSNEARQRLEFLYALVAGGEVSQRAFRLTAQVIDDNAANYTAWICRWRCLRAGHGSKASELAFLRGCTLAGGAKNYQLWNHRRRVALELGTLDAAEEMRFAADCLALEPKNYHAWAHRQVVLLATKAATAPAPSTAADFSTTAAAEADSESRAAEDGGSGGSRGAWVAELEYVDACIREDVRDNSTWAQRFFLLCHSPSFCAEGGSSRSGASYDAVSDRELAFVAEQLRRGAHNGSAWNYLRGLLALPGGDGARLHDERLPQLCCTILAEEPSCSGALELLADVYAARAQAASRQQDSETAAAAAANAAALWQELVIADPVRRRYWQCRAAQLDACMAG